MTRDSRLPFPPVERISPGVWSIPVPIPVSSLRYVLVYAFETDKGPYLVDAGWNTDEAFCALNAGLALTGSTINDVQGILVTHIHPDHYGLAGRVREVSGAWIGLHPADAELVHDRYVEPSALFEKIGDTLRRAGVPKDEIEFLHGSAMPVRSPVSAAHPDILVQDGDSPKIPGWNLVALWTPGHSPGHLCFFEKRHRMMLTGDHVLPSITPNISLHPQAGRNPLGDYLRALDRLLSFDTLIALPAHEHRFADLPLRVSQLHDHHAQRFVEVTSALQNGTNTAWGIARHMNWSRSWDEIKSFERRAAVLEALAHLRALEVRGIVTENRGEPSRWEMTA